MDIYGFLQQHSIDYQRCDHPPVYTCEQARLLVPPLPGAQVKNLFVGDARGSRHFLVVVPHQQRVDLKELGGILGVKKLRFASAARLQRLLGVTPGAVSVLAVIHDREQQVEVVIDRQLWQQPLFQFHPLVNTTTLVIARDDLERFLQLCKHPPRIIGVPAPKRNPGDNRVGARR